jgi:hypothetical protein
MLLEIEQNIEEAIAQLEKECLKDPEVYSKSVKEVKDTQRAKKQEMEFKAKEELERNIKIEKQKEKESRVVIQGGHRLMPISQKKQVVKQKEKKIELTQEQKDLKKYLGETVMVLPTAKQ